MTCRRAGQVLASRFLLQRRLDEQQQHRLGAKMIASVTADEAADIGMPIAPMPRVMLGTASGAT